METLTVVDVVAREQCEVRTMKEVTSVKYKVYPEKQLVCCILYVSADAFARKLSDHTQKLRIPGYTVSAFVYSNSDDKFRKYIGVANCSPYDTFDEELGKKIAFRQAYKQWYSDKMHTYYRLIKHTEFLKSQYQKFRDKEYKTFHKNQKSTFSKVQGQIYNTDTLEEKP